ncbi:hypothetical protein DI487_01940 [Flavobacterium sediminis]|uniref:HTH LytTR-type domain-containing protein n=1 Tax=Flavobacterium sediminis TaxID=2201181 RepID=A0A2U8QSF1_9FLAO|nr:LytTR family transcriptional regulator DNA-binding domain-containing protein [Flavobacterium sediminis]AWM12754.1 hypothetical protein DI487_01940 [Flavobacterium sediminis]
MKKNLTVIVFLTAFFSYAQEYSYREFGLNEGLPSLQVYDIHQDRNGILWFATDRGIANYNGYEIKSFGIQDGVLNNVVLDFHPQADGTVYCSTLDCNLFYFHEDFQGFFPYPFNSLLAKNLNTLQYVKSIYTSEDGSLHLGCEGILGALVISKNGKILQRPDKITDSSETENTYTVLEKKDNGAFFFYKTQTISPKKNSVHFKNKATLTKVDVIQLPGSKYYVYKSPFMVSVFDENIKLIREIKTEFDPISIKAIDENRFFIGYHFGGAKIVDLKNNTTESFLENKSVTNFLIDHEGGYWFTTLHSGIWYTKEPKIKILKGELSNFPVNSLTKDDNGKIFAGTLSGKIFGIGPNTQCQMIYNTTHTRKAFVEFDKKTKNSYFFSNQDLFINKDFSAPIEFPIYTTKISEPQEQRIIFSLINGFSVYEKNSFKTIREFPFRIHDACFFKNDIFLGTPEGVYVVDEKNTVSDLKESNALFSFRVDDIDYNEARNELYFATLGQGVVVYNKNNEKVFSIAKKDGLLSDIINEIYIENKDTIWVCTNSGLNRVILDEEGHFSITGLKSSNGLLNDGINDVEITNDTLWIASKKGLVYTQKQIFDQQNQAIPHFLKIDYIKVNDAKASPEQLTQLSYKESRLEIAFSDVSFKKGNEIIYHYFLEGLDKKWYRTTNRKVIFPLLPPGHYTFKVAVTDSNGSDSKKYLEIPIYISPPFWKNSWFIASLIFAIGIIIYLFFKTNVLSYNKDIIRELIRLIIKKIKNKESYYVFKESGKEIRIKTNTILYVQSAGNYIDLVTEKKIYTIRCKIGDFIATTPDPLEYIRIHRSYIVRIDKIETKSKTEITIRGEKLPVSNSFSSELEKVFF